MVPSARCLPIIAGLLASCAYSRYLPAPPSEEQRAGFGSIAVVVDARPPLVDFDRPYAAWWSGLAVGTGRGLAGAILLPVYGAAVGASGAGGGALVGAALGAVAGAIYLPSSMILGAVTVADPEAVDRAQLIIEAALAEAGHPMALARRFADVAARNAARACTLAGEVVRGEHGSVRMDPRALAADTVIELRWTSIVDGGTFGPWTLNRPCEVIIGVGIRVVRRADRRVVYATTVERRDNLRCRTYVDWADGGGMRIRDELDRALSDVCELLVDELFLLRLDLVAEAHRRHAQPVWAEIQRGPEVDW